MSPPTSVLVVDDHPIVREGIRVLVDGHSGFALVGEAATAREALDLVHTLSPEIVTVDLSLGQGSGFDVLERLHTAHPDIRTMVFTVHHQDEMVTRAFELGASAFVAKGIGREHVLRGLCAIRSGERYIAVPEPRSADTPADSAGWARRDGQLEGVTVRLTPRESEVLQGVADGLTSSEIAARLSISARTVEAYRQSLMGKLSARNRADLVIRAIHAGLMQLTRPPSPGRPRRGLPHGST